MKKAILCFIPFLMVLLLSCEQEINGQIQEYQEPPLKKWTLIVYMAADNDLDYYGLLDLNEMEAAPLDEMLVNVIVLMDRGPGDTPTAGNWTDTRLYEVTNDPGGSNTTVVSNRIACPTLGITATGTTELNMADPLTLEYLIDYAIETYPAENYGLIFWGHGTGWRSQSENMSLVVEPAKAIAIDDSSVKSYMTINEVQDAISGKGLTMIGFDTCFGALLEIAYEFRNCAEFMIGSESAIALTGWNYTALLNALALSDYSMAALADSILDQFVDQYASSSGDATISLIDLSYVQQLRNAFEAFTGQLASVITTSSIRQTVRDIMIMQSDLYSSAFPSDVYIDIDSFRGEIIAALNTVTAVQGERDLITTAAATLQASLNLAVPASWSVNSTTAKRIGVHLIPFVAAFTPDSTHQSAYFKGSGASFQSEFVTTSQWWAPNTVTANSLLDKVFYTAY